MAAIGSVRVSTEDQAKEGVSLDNQKLKIKAYCQGVGTFESSLLDLRFLR